MQASQQLNSTGSVSSRLLKLKFLWSLSSSTKSGISSIDRGGRGGKFVSSVASRDRACSDRHSNYWGKPLWFKLLFYGWILVQNQKTEPFHNASEKSKTATKTDENEPSHGWTKPGPGEFKKEEKETTFSCPNPPIPLFGQLCCQFLKSWAMRHFSQIKTEKVIFGKWSSKYCISIFCWQWREILYS